MEWTNDELALLKQHYGLINNAELSHIIGRSPLSLAKKAFELKLPGRRTFWSKEEEQYLRINYLIESNGRISIKLGRSPTSIQNKATKMGLKLKGKRNAKAGSREWKSEELEYLIKMAGKIPAYKIGLKLNRSFSSVYHKASRLKLPSYFKPKLSKRNRDYNSWSWIKMGIIQRDGSTCAVCGYSKHTSIHHIIPCRRGGTNELDNLITLCPNCHAEADAGNISQSHLKSLIK